jgi:hypothetical protein
MVGHGQQGVNSGAGRLSRRRASDTSKRTRSSTSLKLIIAPCCRPLSISVTLSTDFSEAARSACSGLAASAPTKTICRPSSVSPSRRRRTCTGRPPIGRPAVMRASSVAISSAASTPTLSGALGAASPNST